MATRFLREYEEAYGTQHPNFYAGGYSAVSPFQSMDWSFIILFYFIADQEYFFLLGNLGAEQGQERSQVPCGVPALG